MDRQENIKRLKNRNKAWDIVIIGGGASGLGAALDASARGYETLLLERNDFAKGTSSRSTKLVHGGVRYLRNGDISLVIEALQERGMMRKNAPHLVHEMGFVIPFYDWWSPPFYGLGLKIYDMMSGKWSFGPSTILGREETVQHIPAVNQRGLRGGVIYYDGQFDDARMAISLALTAENHGATVLNYVEVTGFIKEKERIQGVTLKDMIDGDVYTVGAKVVINATGVFSDAVMKMDQQQGRPMIRPSRGVHLVLDKKFLGGQHAMMVPQTTDGRVLFAVPWHHVVVVGTTDTPVDQATDDPIASEKEVDFILSNIGKYTTQKPSRDDVKSIFSGLRPLAASGGSASTKEISRHHKITVSTGGLVSILGGKWTIYRKIAEDAVNMAASVGRLPDRQCNTQCLPIHGCDNNANRDDPMYVYGLFADNVRALGPDRDNQSLSDSFFISKNQILWVVEQEMAMTLEDVLARRCRCLFFDVEETLKIAPAVAEIMALQLNKTAEWVNQELRRLSETARGYQL